MSMRPLMVSGIANEGALETDGGIEKAEAGFECTAYPSVDGAADVSVRWPRMMKYRKCICQRLPTGGERVWAGWY